MAFVSSIPVGSRGALAARDVGPGRRAAAAAASSKRVVVCAADPLPAQNVSADKEAAVVKSLIEIARCSLEDFVETGAFDVAAARAHFQCLVQNELARVGGLTDSVRAALRSAILSTASASDSTRRAALVVLSAVVLLTNVAGAPAPSLAADTATAPPPATMARTEDSTATQRQMNAGSQTVADWRYSEFFDAVINDKVEKVTFSADGSRLLAVDIDGNRFKLDALTVADWRYSEFFDAVINDKVEKVTFSADGSRLLAVDIDGNRFKLDALPQDPDLLKTLTEHKVDVTVLPAAQENGALSFLSSLIFPALLFGGLFLLSRGGGGGPGGMNPMDIGKSGARVSMVPETGITFKDVAGVDNAKLELEEVVQFLKESERFTKLGAKIPRGVILEGPPGTGKTLIARAVAGEAGVPFFSISGSEFVEMFVGVGASRVRDLFDQAKKNAPCIIFIDEIDAVGRQRGAGIAGGNDEREQTLNQLLVEMDGFEGNPGIIVIAATNRADVLDRALLRPGRFDRRVIVDLPDFNGRVNILKVHGKGKPLSPGVDMEMVARRTPGFSGASLRNLLNEAAIFTARRKKKEIGMDEIDDAIERVQLGPAKKDSTMTVQRRELVAFHEAGHAIVGALTPDYDQVAKITIIPRGGAGGLTFFAPNEMRVDSGMYDQVAKITIIPRGGAGGLTFFAPNEMRVDSGMYSKQFLEAQLSVALGGRVAEEIIFGDDEITTGASNDFQQVTRVARQMVTRLGMSKDIGNVVLEEDNSSPFLGRQMASQSMPVSNKTRSEVDTEVQRLVDVAYTRAKELLTANRPLLNALAKRLVENETVTAEEFQKMLAESQDLKMMSYATF
eukprot:CAMPEP_0198364772 /NCGR_PEP_ID=MMETSP1450-20131203/153835_1 /TAXON_ID=753684 ORGANISM="Madagascaria erythrocladiodes, Strain CCMP3234" /NCGR_SAMPLE_ID=MMETSP1450 /ASSEMBLY_ACC=CAM_ASM_001115 /LENGTH=844 /DNA_ID=CAMNT_0044072211 /DNA_START=66 /DNA_END=2601 /DNA_ORIENTATION=+